MADIILNVHRVFGGPFEDEDGDWFLTCRIEDVEAKEMFTDDIPFNDFDSAYNFQSLFLSSIESVEIKIPYNGGGYDA